MNWLTATARVISKSVPSGRVAEAMELDNKSKEISKGKPLTRRWRKEQMTAVVDDSAGIAYRSTLS